MIVRASSFALSLLIAACLGFGPATARADHEWLRFEGGDGPGKGKKIVLVSGDEEYRSEEALPMLAKILSRRHGFTCTVHFAIDPETGLIHSNHQRNIPGLEQLDDADLMVIATRFRNLPDEQMKHVVDFIRGGKPVIGLRTATHAFNLPAESKYAEWSFSSSKWPGGFGQQVLGDTWISHHGNHGSEATRGVINKKQADNPVLRGVSDVFGLTDVYGVKNLTPDATVLLYGQVLSGMKPSDPPVAGAKNDPMMPLAWLKDFQAPGGKKGRAFCTTMGASVDFQSEGLRRLIVNACYELCGLEGKIPAEANVDFVGPFQPTMFGFKNDEYWKEKKLKPADFASDSADLTKRLTEKGTGPLPSDRETTNDGNARGVQSPFRTASKLQGFQFQKGDRVSIVGNTLADRMQHDGWVETLIHARLPDYQLAFRNLGFSADELTIRQRSEGFGSPDEHLAKQKTDVVFAFFGFNESFAGEAGLAKFKEDLASFIKHTLEQKYNGETPPRLVLFSPIAHENLHDANLPDGRENNGRLEMYTRAMAEVAAANKVAFVDLFHPTLDQYEKVNEPLTINGIHLNESGNRFLGDTIAYALFPKQKPQLSRDQVERLRDAVRDQNFYWFNRYRTTDGYSIYGGRSWLKFVNDQTNREVMMREMEVLDVMTDNRDQRIWAVAQGRDLTVDDSNTPPFIPVITNKPGSGPNGAHEFLSGEEEIKRMTVHPAMRVNLYASEEMFPELVNPVQMAWDTKGRLWVGAWESYPHWKPKDEMNDKLLILEDTDGDGKADRCHTFADRLHNPTGFEFWGGGVLVAMAPDLLFIKDTDGDGKADVRIRILSGLDSADTHHTANSFVLGPDGALYFQEGVFHRTQTETPYGPLHNQDACVWRFDPRTYKFERYVPFGFANPHGHSFDYWGQDIVHDGTGAQPYHAALFSGYLPEPHKHSNPPQVYRQPDRPCPGTEFLSSRHFPDELQGNLLVGNVIGFQGIFQFKIEDQGASLQGTQLESILKSSDPNFRPADFEIGPDGALYFTDWHNPIIGHMQHNLRDPSRDRTHGRVYRVTYEGRPLNQPVAIAGEPIDKLLDLLKHPENRVRYRARIELSGRDTGEVVSALKKWVGRLSRAEPSFEHHLLEALWMHQQHNVVNEELLKQVLASKDGHARAAGTRVLGYWRDRLSGALDQLNQLAADEEPRVRLQAIRAASFFTAPEAVEVALISKEQSDDPYLAYTRGETMKALEPIWQRELAAGREIAVRTEAGAKFFLRKLTLDQLLKRDRSRPVYHELLFRPDVRDEFRREAIVGLAQLDKKSELEVLLGAIHTIDTMRDDYAESVVFDLARLLTGRQAAELTQARGEIESLATSAHQPVVRQVAFATLVAIDRSADAAWKLAASNVRSLYDFVSAVPFVSDPSLRASLYPLVEPLVSGLPPSLADAADAKGTLGRYVRIELPRKGTLTLAEVEVESGGRNVARQGKATQKNVAHGGEAARAIDGNNNGSYGSGTQTHTQEDTPEPWWEVDLGETWPLEKIVVYNRRDAELGKRLDGFTIRVLDGSRNEVFKQAGVPAPDAKVQFDLEGGGGQDMVRRAAMNALTYVRGQETKTFQTLAGLMLKDASQKDADLLPAVRAMQKIDRQYWTKEQVQPLLAALIPAVRKLPAEERTGQAALDELEFADALASLLPVDEARRVRGELRELGVRVIRLGTLPERMSYDKDTLAISAGKPVQFVLENADLMPHNFVIIAPGTLEEVGLLAESTAQQPGAVERQYVPPSDKILLASKLLQPRASERLTFTAPQAPGIYPYVCTYPGHWRRMYGALYVVEDLDQYLADPEGYLAAHPLEIHDALLKDRRPRTEWKLEDLAEAVEGMSAGRSFGNAKQMFTVASCVACHKLNGAGTQIGPDLAKLEPKYQAMDILKEVLDPSAKINEKFQTYTFVTDSGRVVTGLVLEETKDLVKVIENPLAKAEPVVLKKSEIDQRQKAKASIMPKGLLDKLSREEILDLIAYIAARGDEHSMLFEGGEKHHH